ncbi:sulfate ABC transporter permease subunit CysT [Seleniivibrio woodruffii]|uniref:Sulfate transport system permease protein CysT n=1 Tax=Seleniivibrio woodruffii TaxID=1078050 RepID=A0A4R1K9D6_9BACT|nr:sulfate ABC transporter permease subunit CysT [Seleniivibrio woodruffii]TCK61008.1 sulfate transport system permease protein [Seleniivibrio woodruffii]TVZ36638.1 sulfate transport system permease protein [Seleniivibrio woodruffii]
MNKYNVIGGFGISMGYTLLYLSLIVIIPLSTVLLSAMSMSWGDFLATVLDRRALLSYKVTILASLTAAFVNLIIGFIMAWVLTRYEFWGKSIINAAVDLPFALPTAVAGITLTALYAESGWIGSILAKFGIKVIFTQTGIALALIFITFPFVVRTVQPALEELESELEEAAASLGASRIQTLTKVIFPIIAPSLITGFALAFARGLGEYGSVIFISGNMPFKTEITPLLIITKLEQFNYAAANALALMTLLTAFTVLFLLGVLKKFIRREQ